ncbi:hypothetical protein M5D96_001359 [Drosophila gunungcola]|uniref:Uncharacterized protein n=1 Tax=Drosophila gunungcola TaxID=103775 RepID=A0A9P9YYB4_9MUSC|nr:hypothetical protein M5D96_001359 [Drosophila gunungcola]
MIMHGTWYKGPQLAHHPHSNPHNSSLGHSDYHQFRSYPSFVVTPYHDGHVQGPATPTPCPAPPTPCNGPLPVPVPVPLSVPVCQAGGQGSPVIVEGSFAAAAASSTTVGGSSATPLLPSPPIKIEQVFGEPSSLGAVEGAESSSGSSSSSSSSSSRSHICSYSRAATPAEAATPAATRAALNVFILSSMCRRGISLLPHLCRCLCRGRRLSRSRSRRRSSRDCCMWSGVCCLWRAATLVVFSSLGLGQIYWSRCRARVRVHIRIRIRIRAASVFDSCGHRTPDGASSRPGLKNCN